METKLEKKMEAIWKEYATPISIIVVGILVASSIYTAPWQRTPDDSEKALAALEQAVLPSDGIELPITWGDLGARLVEVGAIDSTKLKALYESRGGFPKEYERMLEKNANEKIVITNWNSGYLLNLLWALGLANENPILTDKSEMMNPSYGGADGFASTGGWTLAKGSAMNHYNMHALIVLTAEQQELVERVSQNIYRPCCGNSTHFPDCNHGMAMLGLLELMASQGVSEEDMYRTALAVNSYWFPDTYLTIATYMKNKGVKWKNVSPREVLGKDFSSSSGFANIRAKVTQPVPGGRGGGCSA